MRGRCATSRERSSVAWPCSAILPIASRPEEALRQSEARYHSLVESLPLTTWSKDREGRFTFSNRLMHSSLNSSSEEILGKTDFDFFPMDLARKYRQDDERVMETRQVFEDIERFCKSDGEEIYIQTFKSPLLGGRRRSPRHAGHELGCHADEADRGRAAAGARGSPGRQPGQERLPGQHEPRNPHAHERRHRHGRTAARHSARRTSSGPT